METQTAFDVLRLNPRYAGPFKSVYYISINHAQYIQSSMPYGHSRRLESHLLSTYLGRHAIGIIRARSMMTRQMEESVVASIHPIGKRG